MSGPMEGIAASKPPIVQSILKDDHLPVVIARGSRKLHGVSDSARHCRLPSRLIHEEDQDCYGKKANEFVAANDFHILENQTVTTPDPSLKFHYTEADCARSIEAHINDPVMKTIVAGYQSNRDAKFFDIISQTQNSTTTVITGAERIQPSDTPGKITLIPDWNAECRLTQEDGTVKTSALVMEYKNRNLLPCKDFEEEARLGDSEEYLEIATQAAALQPFIQSPDDLPDSSPDPWDEYMADDREEEGFFSDEISEEDVEEVLEPAFREASADAPEGTSVEPPQTTVLGLQPPSRFKKLVKACLTQASSYAQLKRARRVIMNCWNAIIILHFRDMVMKKTAIEQLRAGPGQTCSIVIKKKKPKEFPRQVLGA